MNTPSAVDSGRARRLLTHEGASAQRTEECAAAAARVYEKLNAQLAPLLGAAGVQALFVRSANLARAQFPNLASGATLESAAKLRASLEPLEPGMAMATAEALFGTFFTLIAKFVGERLTLQALRGSWPSLEDPVPTENKR